MTARTTWHVNELVPGELWRSRSAALGYRMREPVELSDDGPGTAMFVVDELSGTSLLGDLFVAISKGFIRRDLQARAALLRAALESAPGTRSSRRAEPDDG